MFFIVLIIIGKNIGFKELQKIGNSDISVWRIIVSYAGTENCFHGALNARCLGINEVLVSDSNRCEALNALDDTFTMLHSRWS